MTGTSNILLKCDVCLQRTGALGHLPLAEVQVIL